MEGECGLEREGRTCVCVCVYVTAATAWGAEEGWGSGGDTSKGEHGDEKKKRSEERGRSRDVFTHCPAPPRQEGGGEDGGGRLGEVKACEAGAVFTHLDMEEVQVPHGRVPSRPSKGVGASDTPFLVQGT